MVGADGREGGAARDAKEIDRGMAGGWRQREDEEMQGVNRR